MNKPRCLLVTTNYWPEPTGISVYTTDLAESLKSEGHQVSVLTSLPHYPWWRVPSEFAYLGEGTGSHNGVSVIRAKHLVPPKMNALLRVRFEASLWWNLRRVSKAMVGNDFDVVIACIPTVAAGIVGKRIAKKLDVPFGLIVQDLSGVVIGKCSVVSAGEIARDLLPDFSILVSGKIRSISPPQ